MKSYMGDARGHCEGDTLVVETTNVLEQSAYGGASDKAHVFEYACHEGNEGLRGILSAARAAEREAGK